jgi:hypothetical protein
MIERIALYATLGLVIDSLEVTAWSWQFWCLIALFWAAEWLARDEGHRDAAWEYADALQDAAEGIKRANMLATQYQQQLKELREHHESNLSRINLSVDGAQVGIKDLQ